MGHLTLQRNRIAILLVLPWLAGCTAVTAVSVVPGALIEAVADQFFGEEESFAVSMETTLAATQLSLRSMELDVDVLEIQDEGGYAIAFGNAKLDGSISLKKQTERLTTVYIKVRHNTREASVERAIINTMRAKIKSMPHGKRFQKDGYHNLRKEPTIKSTRLGWFRPGARLEAYKSETSNWLKVKLPSGKMAYLKGVITNEIVQSAKR